jgi:hypothetical protein
MTIHWTVIVDPMSREDAESALALWLKEQAKQGNSFREDDSMDVIRSKDRQVLVRFCVRTKGK